MCWQRNTSDLIILVIFMAEIPHNVQSAGIRSKISTKKVFKKKLVKSQHQSRAELTKLLRWDDLNKGCGFNFFHSQQHIGLKFPQDSSNNSSLVDNCWQFS